jgi:hypothetical protein
MLRRSFSHYQARGRFLYFESIDLWFLLAFFAVVVRIPEKRRSKLGLG